MYKSPDENATAFSIVPDQRNWPEPSHIADIELFHIPSILQHFCRDSVQGSIGKETAGGSLRIFEYYKPGIAATRRLPYLFDPEYQFACFESLLQLQGEQLLTEPAPIPEDGLQQGFQLIFGTMNAILIDISRDVTGMAGDAGKVSGNPFGSGDEYG